MREQGPERSRFDPRGEPRADPIVDATQTGCDVRSMTPNHRGVVLVTGASSGIGRATATAFGKAGYRVFGTSRKPRADSGGAEMVQLDVRSESSVRRCVEEVLGRAGSIDVLVNNAGAPYIALLEEADLEEARSVFDTNVMGPLRMARAVLPRMRARRRGRIINVGSLAAWVGEPGDGIYAATKHALAAITESLRYEVWPFGIHVSLVEPGELRTGFLDAPSGAPNPIPDYDALRAAVTKTFGRALERGSDPSVAARLIVTVARARAPRLRYVAGRGSFIPYLKVLAPQRLLDVLIRKGFDVAKAPPPGSSS